MEGKRMNGVSGESRMVSCPYCQGKTGTKIYEDTVLLNFPLYCPKCDKEYRIDVLKFAMNISNKAGS